MKHLFLICASAALLAACKDSEFEGFKKAENGVHYHFFNHDENGPKPSNGDGITFSYIISLMQAGKDSVIVNSREVSRDGSPYTRFILNTSFKGSLEDGIMMMAKGDSAEFIVRADSFYLKSMKMNELPKGITQNDHVRAVFKLKDFLTKKEIDANQKKQKEEMEKEMSERMALEKPAVEKYLADNRITAKPTASGLYYIETVKGKGGHPAPTDIVKVNYTGKFLDGKVFDSSEGQPPAEFPLNRVIPGWTEGLQLMSKGGKAKLILPSAIAYGPNGNQGVPPYSPLYFEVELVDFKPAPATGPESTIQVGK
jgi:FKBP-type peptidyl-prolyl cis-trans isomerase FkpA